MEDMQNSITSMKHYMQGEKNDLYESIESFSSQTTEKFISIYCELLCLLSQCEGLPLSGTPERNYVEAHLFELLRKKSFSLHSDPPTELEDPVDYVYRMHALYGSNVH